MKTIPQLEAEFEQKLAKIHARAKMQQSGGSIRGDKVIRGPHYSVSVPAATGNIRDLVPKFEGLLARYYGPVCPGFVERKSVRDFSLPGAEYGTERKQIIFVKL